MDAAKRLSIVIPLYCEADNLRALLDALHTALREVPLGYEIVLVDDGSSDDTWARLHAAAQEDARLVALRLSRNFGKESALAAGLDAAQGDAVILMDGDLQHPPALIPQMVRAWQSGEAEIVNAVKASRGRESLLRRGGAWAFYRAMHALTNYDLRGRSDFKLLDKRVVHAWRQIREANVFFRGMVVWLGFRQMDIPFELPPRAAGASGWSLARLVVYSVDNVVSFSAKPLLAILLIAGVFLLGALLVALQVLRQLYLGTAVSGFATVIFLQLTIGGLVLMSLSLIGLYIAKIYDEVKHRPRYIVAEQVNGAR